MITKAHIKRQKHLLMMISRLRATFDGLKYIKFLIHTCQSVIPDPTTNTKYGTDADGNAIKKGVMNESLIVPMVWLDRWSC